MNRLHKLEIVGGVLGLTLLVDLGATACGGQDDTCLSPRNYSQWFKGDKTVSDTDRASWTKGVAALTPDPQGDIRVGWAAGDKQDDPRALDWRDSNPESSANATKIALKIGHGSVYFSTMYEAPAGSEICTATPDTTFQRKPLAQMPESTWTYSKWP